MQAEAPLSLVRAAMALHYVKNPPRIDGWLHATTALAILETLWQQEPHGTEGNIAEIGAPGASRCWHWRRERMDRQ